MPLYELIVSWEGGGILFLEGERKKTRLIIDQHIEKNGYRYGIMLEF